MHVLIITSEVIPFSKTGGLADVSGAMPRALANRGVRVTLVTPRYASIDPASHSLARRLRLLPARRPSFTPLTGSPPSRG